MQDDTAGRRRATQPASLRGQLRSAGDLEAGEIDRMWRLFEASYEADEATFLRDLGAKSHLILLHDGDGAIRGFSSIALWRIESRPEVFLFSGDTVIELSAWGSPALLRTWLETAGAVHAANPGAPVYWLLTTKGHRTYRYLPQIFMRWYPARRPDDEADLAGLARQAGQHFFPGRYDESSGIIAAAGSHLVATLAAVPPKDLRRADVGYFLERNPGYGAGDELLCLGHLSLENIRRSFRPAFARGMAMASRFR